MAPLHPTMLMGSDISGVHHSDPHFIDTERACACDHCTYFKGIVYRVAVRHQLDGGDELAVRSDNIAAGPRSLESIALAEEVIEQREHTKYMAWTQSRISINKILAEKTSVKMAKNADLYSEASNTLTQWLETATKEELLSWLEKRNNARDDMDKLQQAGIFDLRDYILHNRSDRPTPKKLATTSRKSLAKAQPAKLSPPPESKKRNAQTVAWELRLLAHKSLKPPQAALRQREELRRWYECRKAPELKDECRQRGIRSLPSKKAELVAVLVENDKQGV